MFLCFETIKVQDGKLLNLSYHQKRVDGTRKNLFGFNDILNLNKQIKNIPCYGLYRLRIDYNNNIKSLTCKEYKSRYINSFMIVNSNISYEYKYANRDELNSLLREDCDDIIIVKNGFITDTSIANIALYIDGVWVTPKKPLLHGTIRERLLDTGFLKCQNLTIKDLEKAKKFAIMNGLLGFKIIEDIKIITKLQ